MTKVSKAADHLQQALDTFEASNRFGFLRALQVGRLLGDGDSFGAVTDLTCQRLVELRADGVRSGYRLTSAQIQRLAELIMALGNGPAEAAPAGSVPAGMAQLAESAAVEPALNSVQVELDLRGKLDEARAHPRFKELRTLRLGAHWDPTWPRAPFEEALTIGQLVDMDLSLLFKKRTTSGSRVDYLSKALTRALRISASEAVSLPLHAGSTQLPRLAALPASYSDHPWLIPDEDSRSSHTPAMLALLEVFVSTASAAPLRPGSLEGTMSTLPKYLSRADFLQVLGDAELPPRLMTQIGKWLRDFGGAPCVELIREALQTPGCPVSFLARIVSDDGRYSAFSGMSAIVLARALKAQQVRHGERVCSGMWSLNPSLISLVINEAKRRKGRDVLKTVRELCPALDPILQSWICEVAGSITPRKGRRKGK